MEVLIPYIPRDNPELRLPLREMLTAHSKPEIVRAVESGDRSAADKLTHELAAGGWVGLPLPEEHGGGGASWSDLDLALYELGRVAAPVPYRSSLTVALFLANAFQDSVEAQKIVAAIATGTPWTSAVSEPTGLYEIGTRVRDGGVFGEKSFVFDVPTSAGLLVAVRGSQGCDWYSATADAPGVITVAMANTSGEPQHEVMFDGAAGTVVGEGSPAEFDLWVATQRYVQAAWSCGMMAHALEITAEYAGMREQFGRPIGTFQSVQHRLADCAIQVQACTDMSREAAFEIDESGPGSTASRASVAELAYATRRAARQIVRDTHQVFGGVGFTLEHDLHVFTRRLKSYSLLELSMDTLGEEILALRYGADGSGRDV